MQSRLDLNAQIHKGSSWIKIKNGKGPKVADEKAADIWLSKGNQLFHMHRFEDAIIHYEMAIKIDSLNMAAWYNKGTALDELKKFEDAIKCYNKAIEINPKYADAYYNMGNSLSSLGDYEGAIKSYDESIEIRPDYAEAWGNKGFVLGKRLGNYYEAILCLDMAIKINPQSAKYWNDEGAAFGELGRYDEAIICFKKALKINPLHLDSWKNICIAISKLKISINSAQAQTENSAKNIMNYSSDYNTGLSKEKQSTKTFISKKFGFKIDVPHSWFCPQSNYITNTIFELSNLRLFLQGMKSQGLHFFGPEEAHMNIISERLSPEPDIIMDESDLPDVAQSFKSYIKSVYGEQNIITGYINVEKKNHFWAIYITGLPDSNSPIPKGAGYETYNGPVNFLLKKYILVFGGREYDITCDLGRGNSISEYDNCKDKEKVYDQIVSTFSIIHVNQK